MPDAISKALEELARTRVLIGIPSSARDEGPIDNATLAFIHENGSPARNIPARPFLRPGVANSRDQWEPYLRQAAAAAFRGDQGVMGRALDAAGKVARDAVKNKIVNQEPPRPAPLQPDSVRRRRRHRNNPATAADIAGATPLVDTAQMLNAITYQVVKR